MQTYYQNPIVFAINYDAMYNMPHYRIGRCMRVRKSEFDVWVTQFRNGTSNDLDAIWDQVMKEAVLGVAAYSAGPFGDEVGDKLAQTVKTKGVTP